MYIMRQGELLNYIIRLYGVLNIYVFLITRKVAARVEGFVQKFAKIKSSFSFFFGYYI